MSDVTRAALVRVEASSGACLSSEVALPGFDLVAAKGPADAYTRRMPQEAQPVA